MAFGRRSQLGHSPASGLGAIRASRSTRWAVPVIVAGAVAAMYAVTAPSSDAVPSLPHRSPAQLIAAVERSDAQSFSGQISQVSNFGIPQLPGQSSTASLSWQDLLSGSRTARVWVDGPARQRVAVLGDLSEADVIHDGRNLWAYSSDTNSVWHTTLPAAGRDSARSTPETDRMTPEGVANELLKAVTPSTTVTVGTAQRVAGRPAYVLTLRPRDPRSTVRSVQIAVDATKYLPLRLQVFGASSVPAFQIGFTDISFGRPADSIFQFHPPAGASESSDPFALTRGGHHHTAGRAHGSAPAGATGRTALIGSGWTTVAELRSGLGASAHLLDQLTTPIGSNGDKLVHTALVNAVITPDGRTFVGAVQPAVLEHVADTTH